MSSASAGSSPEAATTRCQVARSGSVASITAANASWPARRSSGAAACRTAERVSGCANTSRARIDVERAARQPCRGGLDRVQVLAVVERRDEPCDRGVGVGVRRAEGLLSAGVSGAHEPSSVPSSAPA